MTGVELVERLRRSGIEFWVEGDQLRTRSPRDVLTPELRAQLTELKPEIIALLRAEGSPGEDSSREETARTRGPRQYPVSFAQERLWLLHQLEPGNTAYNLSLVLHLEGELDHVALGRAVDFVVGRHEALRTAFSLSEGQPVQEVSPEAQASLVESDMRGRAQEDVVSTLQEWKEQPFDLQRGPLFRSLLMRVAEEQHVLAFAMHHIIADGWSFDVLARELFAAYQALSSGGRPELPALPLQYGDFARWQREWLRGAVLDEQLSYWKEKLQGTLPRLNLPLDRPRSPMQTFAGARARFALSPELTRGLRALGRDRGATLFMTLLAAFKVLLHRYTAEEDVVVGTPIANRNREELENLVGFFVNTLVLRSDLGGNPSFVEVLGRVRETALDAFAHQDLPFAKLVEALKPERDLSQNPLFQVMFILQNTPLTRTELSVLKVTGVPLEARTARFDLTLQAWETRDGLAGTMEYNTDLFDGSTIARMLRHWERLLRGIVDDPAALISRLPVLDQEERRSLLVMVDGSRAGLDETPVHRLFERQAVATPGRVALTWGKEAITYRDLDARSNRLSHHLLRRGAGPGSLVALCLERSAEMVVAVLAALKCGAHYLPLDPSHPEARLAFIVKDARAPVLVTDGSASASLTESVPDVVRIDKEREAIARQSTEALDGVNGGGLAYVIYTSGSTGVPKGVEVTHRSVVNFLESMRREPGLSSDDVLLAVTTLSFDIAGLELFLPLTTGASIVLASREDAADGGRLLELLNASRATVMQATPATWRMLIDSGWQGTPGLRVLCGGEALSRGLADELLSRADEVWNLYGPTEATIWSTIHRVEPGRSAIPLGRPIANTRGYVLDASMELLPVGVAGDLYIGGDGLARGYLNRPELTAERFVPDPFGSAPGSRLYKTGDLTRLRADGVLEFLGRADHQIKIRGFRVEIAEIEAVIRSHPGVREAVVVLRRELRGDHLTAYTIPGSPAGPSVAELRGHLAKRLPTYMVPTHWVSLEAFPLTGSGKIDRKRLPAPEETKPDVDRNPTIPRTALERQLLAVWEQVLGTAYLRPDDNFFDLGGHSLLAIRLFAELEKLFGKRLPLATLFQAPTVTELARLLERDGWTPPWKSLVAVRTTGSNPAFFAVPGHGQSVLIFASLVNALGEDQPFYGLEAQGLDGTESPFDRIEDMARHFIEELRQVQPAGPYCLGGYCMGGLVAYEMAQQLRGRGEEVVFLALLDTWPPAARRLRIPMPRFLHPLRYLFQAGRRHARKVWGMEMSAWLPYARDRIGDVREILLQRDVYRGDRHVLQREIVNEANTRAMASYSPKPYPGRLHVMLDSQWGERAAARLSAYWKGLATGPFETGVVTSESGNMLSRASVPQLASGLRAGMAAALDGRGAAA